MSKLWRIIKNLFYSLPFSMKGGDVLTAQSSIEDNDASVIQQVQRNRLSDALMKGEVTQEVEELRYRTYTVAEESKNYSYLGDGVAIKNEKNIDNKKVAFKQKNGLIVEDIYTELKRVDTKEYGIDKYTLKIIYDDIPRFKLEKYCNFFEMNYDSNHGGSELKLHFDSLPDTYDSTSKMFLNEIKRIKNGNTINKNIFSYLNKVSFVTYKVNMEKDLILYELEGLSLSGIIDNGVEYIFVYNISETNRKDLTDKFYSESMANKYKNKEKKENTLIFVDKKRTKICSVCGKEISEYDGDITEATYGKPLCIECLEKTLLSQN